MSQFNAPEQISVEEMHEFAMFVADLYQQKSANNGQDRDGANDIVRAALIAMLHDAVLAHRAVGVLVQSGWSSSAAPLVRTILDVTISALAVIKSQNPRLAAFRYFHAGYRKFERDKKHPKEERSGTRALLRARISLLDPADRPEAMKYLRAKERGYWFGDEWPTPAKIVEEFGSEYMQLKYREYSAAAHGGFLASRTMRDRSFDSDINPRLPIGRFAAVVSLESSRSLLELVCLRDQWEKSGFTTEICPQLRELYSRVVLPNVVPSKEW
ncbi:MAG TPA: DUF5677 domain-containing protein [Longimicrobium sp.]|nr:DUF5677 domain-containing protein [Longimicrobium sp.]